MEDLLVGIDLAYEALTHDVTLDFEPLHCSLGGAYGFGEWWRWLCHYFMQEKMVNKHESIAFQKKSYVKTVMYRISKYASW